MRIIPSKKILFRYFSQTGDMEVKNPLFLDDPTPVQKGTVVLKPQQQQQQQHTPSQSQQQAKPQQTTEVKNSEPATKK